MGDYIDNFEDVNRSDAYLDDAERIKKIQKCERILALRHAGGIDQIDNAEEDNAS